MGGGGVMQKTHNDVGASGGVAENVDGLRS